MKGSVFCKTEEKILIAAEKLKFGKGIYGSQDRQTFMEGVKFALLRLEGGKEALEARGYTIE